MLVLVLQSLGQTVGQTNGADAGILREYLTNPFVLAIWVFFFAGVFALFRYLMKLPSQHAALRIAHENYDRVVKMSETDPEVIRGELLKGIDKKSLTAQRIEELHWISVHGGDFDQVALSEVLAAREGSKISIAKYGASVLVLLGLCGAVFGLSNVVVNIGPELADVQEHLNTNSPASDAPGPADGRSASDAPPMMEAFGKLIKTMSYSLVHTRNAFYASLTGILLSVVLLFLTWIISFLQIKFLTRLEDLTATKLIPIFKPLPKEYELAGALDSFKEGSNYLVRLSDELDGKMSQVGGGLDNLFTIVRKFGEGAQALQSSQDRVYEAQTQMMEVVEHFMALTSKIEMNQAETKENIDELLGAVRESNKHLARAVDEWKDKHESTLQEMQRAFTQARSDTKDARETSRQWIKDTISLVQDSFDRQLNALNTQSLDLLQRQNANNQDHLARIVADQGVFVGRLEESVSKSDGHRELLEGMATNIREERRAFSDQLQLILDRNEKALQVIIGEQRKLLETSGLRRVEERLEHFAINNHKMFSELLDKQKEFMGQIMRGESQVLSLNGMIKTLIILAIVSVPVFAVFGVMFIFDLRPEAQETRIGSFVGIISAIVLLTWFLRSKLYG
ncbi:MAG TPA: hypothetical protein VKA70_18255 [Blastocatellia bacterium]|nr:hypothetical protein [Blastocatellia bacterium]